MNSLCRLYVWLVVKMNLGHVHIYIPHHVHKIEYAFNVVLKWPHEETYWHVWMC